jgi:peptide/nickel transport system substrate-binding protein
MWIGTDLQAIADSVYPGGNFVHSGPIGPEIPDVYTSIQDMPASTQLLFSDNPTLAKQMLATAGYPNGFSATIEVETGTEESDLASLLQSQWSQFGVKLTVDTLAAAAWSAYFGTKNFQIFLAQVGNADPVAETFYFAMPGPYNLSQWIDPTAQQEYTQAIGTTDPVARDAIFKQLCLRIDDQAAIENMPGKDDFGAYWPWVQNFWQEVEGGYIDYIPMEQEIWINPSLKN